MTDDLTTTPKRERLRLAKSELVAHLSMTAERWASELSDREPGFRPFAEWPEDEPMVALCRTYGLTPLDLARLLTDLSLQLQARAERIGYDGRWDDPQPPHRSTIGVDDMKDTA